MRTKSVDEIDNACSIINSIQPVVKCSQVINGYSVSILFTKEKGPFPRCAVSTHILKPPLEYMPPSQATLSQGFLFFPLVKMTHKEKIDILNTEKRKGKT